MTGRYATVPFEELQSYRLFGSSQTIPAFETVLELADGRTPLIIELKAEIVHRELCEKCAVLLDRYPGEYCIESFSPLALGWFKHHRPNVLRGQLATNHRGEGLKTPVIVREMLTYCMLNGFADRISLRTTASSATRFRWKCCAISTNVRWRRGRLKTRAN